ncbi:ferredoxin--NADP reductase [Chromatium okenii]|jgi:ferredoxin--NADP+ reductase|uniref:ferredoxin--NADP(+) reductase n=1 Tax=Chromatium okenii TaxID=61644 RepID=A0A2S7XQU5_9GAMM|nr:ferredoxin--NADP reductase [Chromatium okenii]PQJ96026.1 ferredoxin--NADP(+) reductase [Chromatium okenii]
MSDWVKGQVVGKQQWAEGLYSLQFDAPIHAFKAGQYIKVALDIAGERIGRPYSLVNAPQERPLEIFFNEVNGGSLTAPLSALNIGDPVWLTAAAGGIFTLETVAPAETLWLLATGTGLGVYLSILRSAEPWERFQRVILVHGVRQVADLAYQDLLAEISERHGERFRMIAAVSRETGAHLLNGRITDLLTNGELETIAGATIDPATSHVMLCGNSAMIKDAKIILEARGLVRHRRQAPGHYTTEQYH